MKSVILAAAAAALMVGSAGASVIYSNGTYNGTITAWSFENGVFGVADSFVVSGSTTVDAASMNFVSWDLIGSKPQSVLWTIWTGDPFGGGSPTMVATSTVSIPIAASLIGPAGGPFGGPYDLWSDTISLGQTHLAPGTYWIELSGGSDGSGNIYWDENNGPSLASQNGTDPLDGSEAFTISTPEPETWALMLAGFAGLGGMLRARRRLAAA
jgi:hypothetical protein